MAALENNIVLSWFMLVTIFVTLQMIDGVESSIISRANVAISNKLQNKDLIIHCKDRVRDDGYHSLAPNQRYIFGFTIDSILNRTLWFYRFIWVNEIHYFDIYIQKRDKCKTCE
ncbi:putative plant self-incompatibility S1 [Lupinus albus]|uniref:S-protein homolog n=1 Tax=Lupinus albus TaxID=3870 RepID=A0A6A4QFY1_LUPAL|nr:putative plant self-incompatibility S1 [Lupinus albus]